MPGGVGGENERSFPLSRYVARCLFLRPLPVDPIQDEIRVAYVAGCRLRLLGSNSKGLLRLCRNPSITGMKLAFRIRPRRNAALIPNIVFTISRTRSKCAMAVLTEQCDLRPSDSRQSITSRRSIVTDLSSLRALGGNSDGGIRPGKQAATRSPASGLSLAWGCCCVSVLGHLRSINSMMKAASRILR